MNDTMHHKQHDKHNDDDELDEHENNELVP